MNFKHMGVGVKIWPLAKIVYPERISLGDFAMIDDYTLVVAGEPIILGDYAHVCSYASLLGGETIILEDFAAVNVGARVFSGTEDYSTIASVPAPWPYRKPVRAPVKLCRHALLGTHSIVLPGVTIGEGTIVGALSLVKEDLEPWTIYAGIPCRPIGKRDKASVLECERQLLG